MKRYSSCLLVALCVIAPLSLARYGCSFGDGDVGPFYGKGAQVPARNPDDTYQISGNLKLEAFDPTENQNFPIVVLRNTATKQTQWAMYVDDDPGNRLVRFQSSFPFRYFNPARIKVEITYDTGSTGRSVWVIRKDGTFQGYTVWT
jgi:hypothetical protein